MSRRCCRLTCWELNSWFSCKILCLLLPYSLCFSSTVYGSPLLCSRRKPRCYSFISSSLSTLVKPPALPVHSTPDVFQICPSISFSIYPPSLSYCHLLPPLLDVSHFSCPFLPPTNPLFVSSKAPNFIFFIRLCLSLALKKHSEASHGP